MYMCVSCTFLSMPSWSVFPAFCVGAVPLDKVLRVVALSELDLST